MRSWRRMICRCGWHSEAYKKKSKRIYKQCSVHHLRCELMREHGLEEEETQ